ncbi:hypothetical protein [Leyella stercorea]|uniref:hypothetical protein n=1 Tax=Leyella stercorea TaxID=363265 RepID=UPI00242DE649|nr:hypothetical protein [Leyella stercorea]
MRQPSKKCANQVRSAPTALLVQQRLLHPLGHLRRPMRTSASTVADICADRCGHPRRPMRTSAPTDA